MITQQSTYKPFYTTPAPIPTLFSPKSPAAGTTAMEAQLPRDVSARFGRRLRQLRKDHRMTQLQMAVSFGIDRSFISDLERGRKSVSLLTLEIFALGFKLTISQLLSEI